MSPDEFDDSGRRMRASRTIGFKEVSTIVVEFVSEGKRNRRRDDIEK
jgi:hypothetical protein